MQKFNVRHRLYQLIHSESFCGLLLCFVALIALVIANSPYMPMHHSLFEHDFAYILNLPINGHFLVNDILMSLFFLQVGLEIKFEATHGALADKKHALLPIIAAFGGVLMPALIYIAFNHSVDTMHGWAIPTATDIAFAIGVFSLMAKHFPRNLRVILLSIAIIDDILAILIIALFYTPHFNIAALLFTATILTALLLLAPIKKYNTALLSLGFIALWLGLYGAGIHPTLSGVIIGLMVPVDKSGENRLQKFLHPLVNYLIMPLFAFANGAVTVEASDIHEPTSMHILLGIVFGLCLGKPLGIFLATYIGTRLKICHLPKNIDYKQIIFISLLAGIGFTMALFTILLSFTADQTIQAAKLGVLLASFISALLGLTYGYYLTKRRQ